MRDVAARSGVHPAYLSQIERGLAPTPGQARRLLETYDGKETGAERILVPIEMIDGDALQRTMREPHLQHTTDSTVAACQAERLRELLVEQMTQAALDDFRRVAGLPDGPAGDLAVRAYGTPLGDR